MSGPGTAVDPAHLNGYLASQGWHREGTSRGALIWRLEPDGRLIVPQRLEYDDDGELVSEAVRRLAAFEERPEPDVVLDITEPLVDTQYYRMHPDTPSGTIPLPDGLAAVQAVRDLIRAVAVKVQRGPYLRNEERRNGPVEGFLRRVSLSGARPGSYVLSSRVPVEGSLPRQASQQLDLLPELIEDVSASRGGLSGREVASALHQAVRAAHEAARTMLREPGHYGVFDEGMQQGLSANLCESLAKLGSFGRTDAGGYRAFEVGFGWARERPVNRSAEPVSFSENMVGVLVRAAEQLTKTAKSGSAQITGQVEDLQRRQGEQPRIKIVGKLHVEREALLGRRSVWVVVSPARYEEAWEAHRNGWPVTVQGRLGVTRGRLQMEPGHIDVSRR